MIAARSLLLAALAMVPACARSTPAPAPVPGNVAATAAAGASLVPSFWDSYQRGSPSERCTADDLRGLDRRSPLAAWAKALGTCWLDWQGGGDEPHPDSLAAQVAFAGALLDGGFPHDCVDVLSPALTPYPGGLLSREIPPELEPIGAAAMALGERCDTADAAQVEAFEVAVCPSDDACFALESPEDEAPPADDESYAACPEVVRHTIHGEQRLTAERGPLVDPSFCCGISSVSTYARGGQRYVLVQPSGEDSMFIRECGGGTASATPAAIYRVEGDQLVLDTDRSIAWN